MFLKEPKNTESIFWTSHVKKKMLYYRLSENRLKRVLRNPKRKEEGIAPKTIAVMQPAGSKKHPTEIWLMYQILKSKSPLFAHNKNQKSKVKGQKLRIISAWRYPGRSPVGKPPPIPEDILQELEKII